MATTSFESTKDLTIIQLALIGALAGLAGGLLFGALMAIMAFLPMVGMLVGQESSLVGFIVHMAISAGIGAGYGVIAGRLNFGGLAAVVAGAVYGVAWWVLGALLLMPLMLGMNQMLFVIGQTQWMSLLGHILYGVVTALVFIPLSRRVA